MMVSVGLRLLRYFPQLKISLASMAICRAALSEPSADCNRESRRSSNGLGPVRCLAKSKLLRKSRSSWLEA